MVGRAPIARLLLVGGVAASAVAGCGGKIDDEQCRELTNHLVDLLSKEGPAPENAEKVKASVKNDPRAKLVRQETCAGKITRAQYECMKKAKSVSDFAACDR
ncbi:MAG: hypothetical protein HYV09_04780 [Deltaproteobacteria bacterium]|nr:hypothetical protein [Deltaproteobacteria bacterium]